MPVCKWDDTFYLKSYLLAKGGLADDGVAQALGVSNATLIKWKQQRPALRDALTQGRESRREEQAEGLKQHMIGRLDARLQRVWNRIHYLDRRPGGPEMIEKLLAPEGHRARQRLYLHALITSHFNTARACCQVNVKRAEVERWIREDPDFADLVNEIAAAKGDLFESKLIENVMEGDVPSVIFANKTYNRSRGYGERVEVDSQVNVQADVRQTNLSLALTPHDVAPHAQDQLSLDEKWALLRAARERERLQDATPPASDHQDAPGASTASGNGIPANGNGHHKGNGYGQNGSNGTNGHHPKRD